MIKYDDLINKPYKQHGRGNDGYDCYGLVLECCNRAGAPIKDVFKDLKYLNKDLVVDYINKGINVKKIKKPKVGCIVEFEFNGNAHVGYLVERNQVLHSTVDRGVKVHPTFTMKISAYYEVVNESNNL